MHVSVMNSAKKKALGELIHKMRALEAKESPAEEAQESPEDEAHEQSLGIEIHPDDEKSPEPEMPATGEHPMEDLESEKRSFMKRRSTTPVRGKTKAIMMLASKPGMPPKAGFGKPGKY